MNEKKLLIYSDLNRLSPPVLSPSNRQQLITQTLKDIRNIFKSPFCWISIYVDDSLILTSSGSNLKRKRLIASKLLPKLFPQLLRKTYPFIYDRSSESTKNNEILFQFLSEQNIIKFMGVPFIQANQLIGTLNVVRENKSPSFTPENLKQLTLLGSLLSMTLHTPAREKLQHTQEFLEAIIDNLPNPVFIKDSKHRWVVINQAFSYLTGYPRDKMLGKSDYDLFPKVQADFFWKKDREMFSTGRVIDIPEETVTDKNGKIHNLHTRKAPLKDSTGEITHLVGIIEDITESKRRERELILKEQIARQRAQLLNDLRFLNQEDDILTRVCVTIRDSGLFERAVMTLHDESRQITHLGQVGLPRKMIELARKAPPLDRKQIKRIMRKRFRISDSFFVPAEAGVDFRKSGRYIPQKKGSPHADWQVGDELFVPLHDFTGKIMGYLSVDTPKDGLRPNLMKIHSMEMLVEAAASRIRELDAQKALQTSEDKLRAMFDSMADGITVADLNGEIIQTNRTAVRMFGYLDKEEVIGQNVLEFIHPREIDRVKESFNRITKKGIITSWLFTCLKKDRSEFPIELSATAIRDVRGKPTSFVGIIKDITSRKKAEEELYQSQARYKALIEQIPAHTYTASVDEASTSLYISPQIEKLIGYTPTDFRRDPDLWRKRLHPDDKKRVLTELRHSHATGNPFVSEYRMIHRDGITVWLRDEAVQVLDQKGKPLILQGVMTDITDRKSAEEEQHKSEEKYRLVVENANEAIVVAQEGYMKFVNPKMIDILGYSEKALLSKPFVKFIHPEDRNMVLERHIKRIKGEEVPPIYDFRVIDKKGNIKWLEINAVAIAWDNQPATLNFLTDMTKRKQDEQLKEQYYEQKLLFELTQVISSATSLNQMLKLATEKVTEFLQIERSSIVLINPDGNSATFKALHVRAGYGVSDLLGFTFKSNELSKMKELIRKPFVVNDTSNLPQGSFIRNFLLGIGVKSNLSVSLSYRDKILGGLTVATKIKYHNFTAEEVRLLQIIANSISAIIVNYQLLEDLKLQTEKLDSQLKEQKMLFELTQNLSSTKNLEQLLKSATQKVTEIMNIERSSIILVNPDGKSATFRAIHVQGGNAGSSLMGFTFKSDIFTQLTKLFINKPFLVSDTSMLPQGSYVRNFFMRIGIKSNLTVALVSRGKFIGSLSIAAKKKHYDFTPRDIRLLQILANPIALAIENYLLLENLKTQALDLKKQTQEKDILLIVSQALSQTMDIDGVANTASEVVGKTLGIDRCSIILLVEEGSHVEVRGIFSQHGAGAKKLIGKRYPIEMEPHWRNIIAKRKVLVINDIAASGLDGIIKEHHLKEGLKSLLVTGMFFGTKLIGVLALSSIMKPRSFSRDEIQLAQTIANQIAVAIENARLMQMVKVHTHELKELSSQLMKAQEGERKRIAQELHDQVGQMLQSMKMNLDRMKKNLSTEPQRMEDTKDWLLDTEKLLSQTIDDIRTLTFNLRPSMLDDFGLFSTLRWYIEDYSRRSNVKVTLKGKEDKYRFPLEIEVNLYRIIQEALTNVTKHAAATEVTIFLSYKSSCAILSVKDNGRGFDTLKLSASPHKGTGIYNMQERVNLLGGDFEITSRTGKGTRINVKIPFTEVKYEEGQIIDR